MSHEKKPSPADLFPLPEWVKIRTRKFGANPVTPLQPIPSGESADANRPEFLLRFQDQDLGIVALVGEDRQSRHLLARVFSSKPEHLNEAAVSVAIVGTVEDQMLRKSIPLNTEEHGDYHCSGSADFGRFDDVVGKLGDQLGLIVFLLINPPRSERRSQP
jgi:hypothetical protein